MSKGYELQQGKQTWKQLQTIQSFGYSASTIFSDFIEACLFSLLSLTDNIQHPDVLERLKQNKLTGVYEEGYMGIVAKYKENKTREKGKRPIDYIANAWGALQQETHETQSDILGEIFMANISFGEHGQYFTPQPLSDMMAALTGTNGKTVCDPACGSGRMFLGMTKQNKDIHCYGVDISPICAKMTTLNMWLFDITADIYQGDTLTMDMSHLWKVRKGGFVYHESIEGKTPAMPEPVKQSIQQSLFD